MFTNAPFITQGCDICTAFEQPEMTTTLNGRPDPESVVSV